jgi:hypothetical protein
MSFYVTLLSDDRENGLVTNLQNNFTTFLTPTINLPGKWDVALTEMSNSTVHNVNLGTMIVNNHYTHDLTYRDGMPITEVAYEINKILKLYDTPVDWFNLAAIDNNKENETMIFKRWMDVLNSNEKVQFIRVDSKMLITFSIFEHIHDSLKKVLTQLKDDKYPEYINNINVYSNHAIITFKSETYDESKLTNYEKEIKKQYETNPKTNINLKQLIQDFRYSGHVKKVVEMTKKSKTRSNEYEVEPLAGTGWYEIYESDYYNTLYPIVEANTDTNMLLFRKLRQITVEFRGIIANVMNKDPANHSYLIEKPFQKVPFVSELNLINQFVIYTDIIEEQYYGGQQRQVIHTLNLTKNVPAIIDSPHYVRVNKSTITSINIRICDRTGEPIKFSELFSNVLIKLHFRQT